METLADTKMDEVKHIMIEFAETTGLAGAGKNTPRRYLWTDAFAVCNFLALYRRTNAESWRQLSLALVDQVHYTLGRHRSDDARTGWISGLSEDAGRRHPTARGLRIGKKIIERAPEEQFNQTVEWDRDGQYYHYLTRWMHALDQLSRATGNPNFNRWAVELAKAAHSGFVHALPDGSKRMYWKMSIDLSYPLVPSMGQHDPLDGWITCEQLQATAAGFSDGSADLKAEIEDLAEICRGKSWTSDDPLGIGGLLCDACRLVQLTARHGFSAYGLLQDLLESSLRGLSAYMAGNALDLSADYRLAFRELGLAIGLQATGKMRDLMQADPEKFAG